MTRNLGAINQIQKMINTIEQETKQYTSTKNLKNKDGTSMTTPTCAVYEILLTYKKELHLKLDELNAEK